MKDTNMAEIFKGALPFVAIIIMVMIIVILFPQLATWIVTQVG